MRRTKKNNEASTMIRSNGVGLIGGRLLASCGNQREFWEVPPGVWENTSVQ